MDTGEQITAPGQTLRRGVELSPELTEGLGVTVVLAVLATLGRVVVPIAVQQTVDRGLGAAAAPTSASWRAMRASPPWRSW